ncbi:pre-mRNA-splicing factor 38B [Brachyistius frenatus]|uniref:pre-mRNA-splicing factor 38B n=1 Tax=Brachyistius frenatus TaxID=100188 RepID=UPI0037E92BDB
MANVGNQLPTQAVSKPAPGKHGNVLPLWGNEKTMNLNPMILTNVLSSPYFKVQLYELKTYHEVVDEIYFKVTHVEPWEKGSRKTAGQTGMCGGVRGVGTGGIVSTAFCLLYKLFTLKLTRKQLMGLITHTDSPYIRALGFMYIRYTQPPTDLIDWYDGFLDDEEELDVKAGGGCVMTIGEMLRSYLTKLEWFSTLFPRIPVPVQKVIDQQIKARPRKVAPKETQEEEEAAAAATFTETGRQGERRRSRTPRRTPSPRRSPKRSRSRSHHRERDRHGPSFDRELERERDRQRKEREGRDRGDRGDRERRRSRSVDRNQDRRERRRSCSGSRDKRSERREKERDGGDDRNRKKDRDHHKDRGTEREKSRDKKSKGETEDRRHKDDRERHREERKAKRSSRSRSRERKHKGGGEEKSRKSREKDRDRDGEQQRSHKRSGSKEKSHHQRESINDHNKHSDRRRSQSTE